MSTKLVCNKTIGFSEKHKTYYFLKLYVILLWYIGYLSESVVWHTGIILKRGRKLDANSAS